MFAAKHGSVTKYYKINLDQNYTAEVKTLLEKEKGCSEDLLFAPSHSAPQMLKAVSGIWVESVGYNLTIQRNVSRSFSRHTCIHCTYALSYSKTGALLPHFG